MNDSCILLLLIFSPIKKAYGSELEWKFEIRKTTYVMSSSSLTNLALSIFNQNSRLDVRQFSTNDCTQTYTIVTVQVEVFHPRRGVPNVNLRCYSVYPKVRLVEKDTKVYAKY